MTATRPAVDTRLRGGVGDSPLRPDGVPKVTGEFAYSSDLWVDGMLWGATARSPHPRALIRQLDPSAALALLLVDGRTVVSEGELRTVSAEAAGRELRAARARLLRVSERVR